MTEPLLTDERFSQPAADNSALQAALNMSGAALEQIPSISAILQSLLAELNRSPEDINLSAVAELVGRDESLAAQCLRVANSALYSRGKTTSSLLGAVRTLGIAQTRDIAIAASMMRIGSAQHVLDPVVFWEHSLGCAIISRKLARSVGFADPEKAYLAGLLHDIGYIVNIVLSPRAEKAVLEKALREGIFAGEVEYQELGFTHCQSGEFLARKWKFPDDIVEVIVCHHNPSAAVLHPALVTIVALADRLCRSAGLGIGYRENLDPAETWETEWKTLESHCPMARHMTWADFVKDVDAYFAEVRQMVTAMLHTGG